jgi:hypothetical protein
LFFYDSADIGIFHPRRIDVVSADDAPEHIFLIFRTDRNKIITDRAVIEAFQAISLPNRIFKPVDFFNRWFFHMIRFLFRNVRGVEDAAPYDEIRNRG